MYCPSLSLFMDFVLKSILSHVSIATPAFFLFHVCVLGIFFPIPSLWVYTDLLFWGGSLLDSIYGDHVFLSIQLPYVFRLEHLIHLHLRLLLVGTYLLPFFSLYLCSHSPFLHLKAVPLASLEMLIQWRCILLTFFFFFVWETHYFAFHFKWELCWVE